LFQTLLLKSLSFLLRGVQSDGRGLPPMPGRPCRFQTLCEGCTAQLIQPTSLLTRTGELLRLSLNREINQQWPQLQKLLAIH
jgi:hypothetical protein